MGEMRISVTAKIDAHGERFEPEQYIGPNVPLGADRLTAGAGVDVEWQPTRRLTVAGALRGDAWRDASSIAAPSLAALPNGHVGIESRFGSVLVAAHAGYTARPANFVELFGTPGGFIANPTLKPESAFTVDTGARTQRRIGPLRIEAELDAFAQSARDIITFVTVSERALPHAENIGAAVLLGAEASVRLRAWGIDLRASYSGLFSENTSACTFEGTCPPLPGRPAHDLVLDASYTLAPFTIRYGLDVVAGIDLDPAGTIEVPARALQSVGVRIDVPRLRGVRVSADVRNVFDVRTATYAQPFNGTNVTYPIGDAYYYPLAGRSVLLSVGWQPRRLASGDASLALEIGTTNPP
jgi:outer membrane receptor protein involved in Fe transport